MSARKNIYDYIKTHGIRKYAGDELRAVGAISEWARVLRQLRQDNIIDFEYDSTTKVYDLKAINTYTSTTLRSGLSSKDKYKIRNRDGHRCQSCGKGVNDGMKLHVDHKIPIDWGGSNLDDNLWTLCDDCNLAKKAFFKDDFDVKVMKLVFSESSGYQRLKVLFEQSPNVKFTPSVLQGISGIRDWTRTIRDIRNKYNINISWVTATAEFPNGYYTNVQ
ncbi:restriction endonuclease [Aequorivita sublithincola DSM 14238]|uniref:Restriction endonuclease n=1 Tax=Aequorivita sublithincola (strain DSM 14238 / LMG 21431 / ACAM 643 / 9-3) TaxID=746697 RepID=I3YTC9_AEQSU|nr:HNH endonuclease signature motif containing protein [Aequorivita sublithincola]AFL80247.1 restriction endonuclease [Aequorivita sublithincola DSM 14238]